MRPGHWLALGSAIAGCTAALGIYLVAKEASPADPAPRTGAPRWQPGSAAKRHGSTATAPGRAGAEEKSAAKTRQRSGAMAAAFRIQGDPPAGPVTEERAWFANAERVERAANRELETLRETLELSPYQEQRIFGILARRSPFWLPGMATGGSHGSGVASDEGDAANPPAGSVTDELLPVLDEAQQQALIDEELDRRAWWEEILPQLLPPEFPAATAMDDPAASLPGAGDTKAYEGPTEMLEE